MKKGIFISIKPEFTKKIEKGEKNYEFRKYIPKEVFDQISSPSQKVGYSIEVAHYNPLRDKDVNIITRDIYISFSFLLLFYILFRLFLIFTFF